MDIRFEPSGQDIRLPHLKRLSWRIIHMFVEAQSSGDRQRPHLQALKGFRAAIDDVLRADGASGPVVSLVDFLDQARQRVSHHVGAAAADEVEAVDSHLEALREHFDCNRCSLSLAGVCAGSPGDALYICEDNGGRCLTFLVELVEACVTAAAKEYEQIVGDDQVVITPRIRLSNRLARNVDATMPIDAEFTPGNGDAASSLTIIWPLEPDRLVDAVLLLPYLLFHEIFVHGAQMALLDERDLVDPECAFTEGTVDTVAYRILTQKVIDTQAPLPNLLKPMRWQFERQTHVYFGLRNGEESLSLPKTELPRSGLKLGAEEGSSAMKIAHARRIGFLKIFEFLMSLTPPKRRNSDYFVRLILIIHLVLNREQRRALVEHIMKLKEEIGAGSDEEQADILRVFNRFLRGRDPRKLLEGLEKLAWPRGRRVSDS